METTLTIPGGIPGFPELTEATLRPLDVDGTADLYAELTSLEDPSLSLLLAQPFAFFPDYEFRVDDATTAVVGEGAAPQAWVVLSHDGAGFTANLRGPLLINPETGAAAQAVLDDRYALTERLG